MIPRLDNLSALNRLANIWPGFEWDMLEKIGIE